MRVLLVDDETSIREVLRKYLEALGHEVVEFSNPEDAYEAYRTHGAFDLVVTDFDMPKYNGFQLAELIRSVNNQQNILMSTGSDWARRRFKEDPHSPVDHLLMKPYGLRDFEVAIERVVRLGTTNKVRST